MRSYTVAPLAQVVCVPESALCIMDIAVPAATASSARLQLLQAWIAIAVDGTMRPELGLLNLHFFNICRHHPTLKFKPHATDDER